MRFRRLLRATAVFNVLSLPLVVAVAHAPVFDDKRVCRITALSLVTWWSLSTMAMFAFLLITAVLHPDQDRRSYWIDAGMASAWIVALLLFSVFVQHPF